MKTIVLNSTLEVQMITHKQALYVPMNQRSREFRRPFTPMESDPTKDTPAENTSLDVHSMRASRYITAA